MISIYVLVDPRDRRVYYVGRTSNVEKRLRAHRSPLSGAGENRGRWIADLRRHGLRPTMIVIGEVPPASAESAEQTAIRFYLDSGAPLVNGTSTGRMVGRRCTGTKANGEPCNARGVRGRGANLRCVAHSTPEQRAAYERMLARARDLAARTSAK